MKPFRALLVLLATALIGAFGWHVLAEDPGYLLLTFRHWAIETTLVVAVLSLLALAAAVYVLLGLLRAPWRIWQRRRRRAARERLANGLLALQEGRWVRAEKSLRRAAADPDLCVPALMLASQAARERGDPQRADELLSLAGRSGAAAAALPAIKQLLADGRPAIACEVLEGLQQRSSLPPLALELRARALAASGRSDEAVSMLPSLRRTRVREGVALESLESDLLRPWLLAADSNDELNRRWDTLDRASRLMPNLVDAFAERAQRFGQADAAGRAIERALAKSGWCDRLARRYGSLPHPDAGAALAVAEHWLEQRPNDPGVLVCLGRLCRHDQLWGKAEAYLGRAIGAGAGSDAWEALAQTYADQHDDTRARQAYTNAMNALRGDPVRPVLRLQAPGEEHAVAEERSSMGLPRLPVA
jgi:HemY protein